MPVATDRNEFAPPPQPGLLRALVLAVLAHALLLLALMSGLQWKREAENVAAEAELWARVPQEAAPREVAPPPPPPAPVPEVRPAPPPSQRSDADIAQEREKQRRQAEAEAQKRREEAEKRREAQRKAEADRKRAEEQKRQQAAERKRLEEDARRREEQQEKRLAQQREENLRRMQGLAGASGAPGATGTAMQSSGPSASWAGRVRARVKPNIVFTDNVTGNPEALVEVRLAPDGTIVGKRVVRSSGLKTWDDAVLRALEKTEVLPRDVDGRVPPQVELVFRPKD